MREFNHKSWLVGFVLRLVSLPRLIAPAQREPVAYLYNGAQLPDINEVNEWQYTN